MTKGTDQYDTAGYENPNRFVEKGIYNLTC